MFSECYTLYPCVCVNSICLLSILLLSNPLIARRNTAVKKTDTVLGPQKIEVSGGRNVI